MIDEATYQYKEGASSECRALASVLSGYDSRIAMSAPRIKSVCEANVGGLQVSDQFPFKVAMLLSIIDQDGGTT